MDFTDCRILIHDRNAVGYIFSFVTHQKGIDIYIISFRFTYIILHKNLYTLFTLVNEHNLC